MHVSEARCWCAPETAGYVAAWVESATAYSTWRGPLSWCTCAWLPSRSRRGWRWLVWDSTTRHLQGGGYPSPGRRPVRVRQAREDTRWSVCLYSSDDPSGVGSAPVARRRTRSRWADRPDRVGTVAHSLRGFVDQSARVKRRIARRDGIRRLQGAGLALAPFLFYVFFFICLPRLCSSVSRPPPSTLVGALGFSRVGLALSRLCHLGGRLESRRPAQVTHLRL